MLRRLTVAGLAVTWAVALGGCDGGGGGSTPNPALEVPKSTSKPGDAKAARGGGAADGVRAKGDK